MRKSQLLIALVVGLTSSGGAFAFEATGRVETYHVNVTPTCPDRGGCIRLQNPASLPGGWGCVYPGGGTGVQELQNLLRDAMFATEGNNAPGKVCKIFWNTTDCNGFARIYAAECLPREF